MGNDKFNFLLQSLLCLSQNYCCMEVCQLGHYLFTSVFPAMKFLVQMRMSFNDQIDEISYGVMRSLVAMDT